jgi:hypothetical protein
MASYQSDLSFRLAASSVLLLFYFLLFCAVGELYVRYCLPQFIPSPSLGINYSAIDHVLLGEKNKSFRQFSPAGDFDVEVRYNKYGFRDVKDISSATERDIFVVGDSFSFGHGVAEEKRFSNVLGSVENVAVYNISIPSLDLDGYEKLIDLALQKTPNLRNIIISLCMENDLRVYGSENTHANMSNVSSGMQIWRELKVYLSGHSAFYRFLIYLVQRYEKTAQLAKAIGISDNYVSMRPDQDVINSTVAKLQSLAKRYNMIVLVIPSRGLWVGDNIQQEKVIHESLLRELERRGVSFVDVVPLFAKDPDPLHFYYKHDGHWTEEAHSIAGKALAAAVHNEFWGADRHQ